VGSGIQDQMVLTQFSNGLKPGKEGIPMKNFEMNNNATNFSKMILVGDEAWNLCIDHRFETPKNDNYGYKPWVWFAHIAIYDPENMKDGPEWAFAGSGDTLAEAIQNLKTQTKIMKDGIEIPAYQAYPWFDYVKEGADCYD